MLGGGDEEEKCKDVKIKNNEEEEIGQAKEEFKIEFKQTKETKKVKEEEMDRRGGGREEKIGEGKDGGGGEGGEKVG